MLTSTLKLKCFPEWGQYVLLYLCHHGQESVLLFPQSDICLSLRHDICFVASFRLSRLLFWVVLLSHITLPNIRLLLFLEKHKMSMRHYDFEIVFVIVMHCIE